MKITKPFKIIGVIALSLVGFAIIGNIALNVVIKNKIPKIISERNDTAYDFDFEDIRFSIFKNTLSVENVKLIPKKNANIKKDIDFFGQVEKINVSGVNFYELIKNKNLKAFTISIIKPDITVLKPVVKDTLPSQSKLTSVIDIDKISVQNAHIKMMTTNNDTLLHEVHNFNAEIDGIHMGEYTVKKDIPFTYTDYKFKIDSIYSLINDSQFASSHYIDVDKDHIQITNFKLLPHISSKEFKTNQTETNSLLYVDVPKLHLKNTDWGYDQLNDLYVNIDEIEIDSINVKILEQKNKTVIQQAKKNVENIIKPIIPFTLNIDEVAINKSAFNSLESLDISNVNIKIKGISNKINQHLTIKEFQLNNPIFTQIPIKRNNPKSNRSGKLNDVIIIDKVAVNNAKYILKDKYGKKNKLVVNSFNLSLNNIKVDDKTVLQNIPFYYENPVLKSGAIVFDGEGDYKINVANIEVKEHNASLNGFKMTPKINRSQHAAKSKYAQDYYNLAAQSLNLNNFNWGFNAYNEFYINFAEVVLNGMDAKIYRDITNPLNPKKNELFSNKLRTLNFPFDVKVLRVKNSKLIYQEDSATSKNPGKLSFTNFNLTAQNIYSGYRKSTGPKTQIIVTTTFMEQGNLTASWQFDIMDKNATFNINGTLKNFPAPAMNPFLKPYLNVAAHGKIDRMAFNFSGNDTNANGDFAMNYENLKMTLFNKEDQERKVLSAAANLVLRSDTDGLKKTEIKQVERHKQKSFFNFLWLCIMQGLKQTVI